MRNHSIFAALRGEKEPEKPYTPLYRMPERSAIVPEVKSNTTSDYNGFYDEKNWDADGNYIGPDNLYSGVNKADGIQSTVLANASTKDFVFVYGTLKKDGQRSSLLQNCEYLGPAITGINYDLKRTGKSSRQYDFPILFKNSKYVKGRLYLSRVVGELYNIDHTTLNILDGVENIPKMFTREKITVYKFDPEKNHIKDQVNAYTYLGNQEYWENTELYDCAKTSEKAPHLYYPIEKGIVT
jgi:gamma-glutamylcyclotransferase (GGCT)/AIG2-like uncharacterized protein YtfP